MHNFYTAKSCGCLVNENRTKASTTHGHTKSSNPERRKWYDRWRSMVRRCYNVNFNRYMDYGGRGIRVCDRWLEPNGTGCENYYNEFIPYWDPNPDQIIH